MKNYGGSYLFILVIAKQAFDSCDELMSYTVGFTIK